MTTRIYKSTDAGAPALDRNLGSLINVIDACLVTGFGAGATATPLGWTKEFTATNQAAYKMPVGTSERCLLVHDDLGDGHAAKLWGFDTMSAIDTGTDKWPVAGSTDGVYWQKNQDAGYNADWQLIGDEAGFYFIRFIESAASNYAHNHWMNYFGDGIALNLGDDWLTTLGGHYADGVSGDTNREFKSFREAPNQSSTATPIWAMRSYDGTQIPSACGREASVGLTGSVSSETDANVETQSAAARIIAIPAYINAPSRGIRGMYPGLLLPLVGEYNCTHGDTITFDGVDYFKARLQGAGSNDVRCTYYIQLTGDWRA